MSQSSSIEWTDHTASPWHGCSHGVYFGSDGNEHEHPGCLNCYAETMSKRNQKTLGVWGKDGTRVMSASFHNNCRKWNKQAERDGVVRSVFPSICDPFEDWDGTILNAKGEKIWVSESTGVYEIDDGQEGFAFRRRWATMNDLRRDLFATIDACQHLRFLLLTKRPGNVRRTWGTMPSIFAGVEIPEMPRPNVALIASISDQATADAMIPLLLECRDLVPILGVSYEPAIGPVKFRRDWLWEFDENGSRDVGAEVGRSPIDWVIVGGESGHNARPFIMDWGISVIQQCRAAGVPVFMKQVGSNPMINADVSAKGIGTSVWGPIKDSKGGVTEEWPIDLRVRQFQDMKAVPA
jgi:hypothetical protein